MTTSERSYTRIVLFIGSVLGVLSFGAVALEVESNMHRSSLSPPNPLIGLVYAYIGIACAISLLCIITSVRNLYCNSLRTTSTILQSVVLCLTCYLIPIGLWGFYLLSQTFHRNRSPSSHATP